MSKTKIAIISTVVGILAVITILFSAVFVLRKIDVVMVTNEAEIEYSAEDIVASSNLKTGTSIFMLDKDSATDSIEAQNPYIKVIQIKTTSAIRVEIRVRSRCETFYTTYQNKYFVLDEELKVLRILETGIDEKLDIESAIKSLIYLEMSNDDLGITSNTVVADFLSTEYYQSVISNLYAAIYKTVKWDMTGDGEADYLSRAEIIDLIDKVSFGVGYSLDESYVRLILDLKTGLKIDIGKPEEDLEYKVNFCFSAISELDEEQQTTGRIKYYYSETGEAKAGYFSE